MAGFQKTVKQVIAISILTAKFLYILLYGGARSGKTMIFLYAIICRALKCKSRHLVIRKHFSSVKTSIGYDSMPKALSLICPGVPVDLNKSDWFWLFPNGSEIWLGGLDDKERTEKILGKEYSTIFFNECSEMSYDSVETALSRLAEKTDLINRAYFDCNPPKKSHWTHKVFVEKIDPITNVLLLHPELYMTLLMNPADNESNLPENYIRDFLENLSDRKRKRFLLGEWLDDVEGALWNNDMISAYRIQPDKLPDMARIVVGVDPAVTSSENADETGIVVAGVDGIGHCYVLEDKSLRGTPLEWGRAVIAAYIKWNADRIIGEVNNGGDLVEMNLRSIDPNVPYKSVHASKGKYIRAEPVAGMYEQGRVHHVGEFPELEDEMCSWTPESKISPNRLDGCVWSITELGITVSPHVWSGRDNRDHIEMKVDAAIDKLLDEMTPQERIDAERIMRESVL